MGNVELLSRSGEIEIAKGLREKKTEDAFQKLYFYELYF